MAVKFEPIKNFLYTAILLAYTASNVEGQIAGGLTETTNTRMGGNNYVIGTVFSPTGMPVDSRISIRLVSPEFGDFVTTTDDSGRFVFSGVGNGLYILIIDSEPEFESVREEIDVVRKRSAVPETYTLTIRLRDKVQRRTKADKPAVIKVTDAAVPKQALKHFGKASELAISGDHRGAIKQLQLAVEVYPKFVNAWNEIGVLYLRLNEIDKAYEALQAALKIQPDAYEASVNHGIALFRLTRLIEAETVFRSLLKTKADSGVAYYYLGRTLNKLGRNDEAETAYLTCIKMSPGEFKEAHRLLAVIYLDRNLPESVIEQLETYLRLVPNPPDAKELQQLIQQLKNLRDANPSPRPL